MTDFFVEIIGVLIPFILDMLEGVSTSWAVQCNKHIHIFYT